MAYIFNLSMKKSSLPEDFKVACVSPLHKNGQRNNEGNYWPIEVLPVLFQVFERIVPNHVMSHLNSLNIFLYVIKQLL